MTGKKKILFAAALTIMAAAIFGFYMWNKPAINVTGANGLRIDAVMLYKAFLTDSALAKRKYINQVLEVSGVIKRLLKNQQNQAVILLNTGTEGAAINCTLEGPEKNVNEDDTSLIKGICTGIGEGDPDMGIPGDVYMTRCYLAK